jgi:hypothetical protein
VWLVYTICSFAYCFRCGYCVLFWWIVTWGIVLVWYWFSFGSSVRFVLEWRRILRVMAEFFSFRGRELGGGSGRTGDA